MRIGLFTNNYRPLANGLVTSIDTFAQAFRSAGHQVTIVAPRYDNKPSDPDTVLRVPGFRAPTHHAYVLPIPWWPGIRQTVANLDLDVYHAQHPFLLGAAAARWAHRANRPLVFTYHTRYDRYAHYVPGPSRIVATMALRRALAFAQRADSVIAPTPSVARDLCSARGADANRDRPHGRNPSDNGRYGPPDESPPTRPGRRKPAVPLGGAACQGEEPGVSPAWLPPYRARPSRRPARAGGGRRRAPGSGTPGARPRRPAERPVRRGGPTRAGRGVHAGGRSVPLSVEVGDAGVGRAGGTGGRGSSGRRGIRGSDGPLAGRVRRASCAPRIRRPSPKP